MIRRIILAVLLVLACAMPVLAGVSVSGKVIDAATNEPLIGATIIVPEDVLKKAGSNVRNVNALTDIDGNFTITLPDGVDFMECRYVGYTPESVEIKGDVNDMLIAMTSSTTELEEVVVTGYQKIEKRKLTASIQTVSVNDNMVGSAMSIDQALAGQIAGLSSMKTSGAPGASP